MTEVAPRAASLRGRLVLAVLGAALAVFAATAAYVYLYTRHEVGGLLDAHLAQAASLIVAQTGHDLEEIELEHAPELNDRARRVAFQIWEDGKLLRLHSARAPGVRLSSAEEGFSDTVIEGRPWRVFSAWDDAHRTLVQVGERADARRDLVRAIVLGLLAALALALPALFLIAWVSIGRAVAPLRALGDAVAAREPGALAPLAVRDVPREVRPLVTSLNALFARVGRLVERERRFTADAAHELRTPLAAAKTNAQVAREARTDEERRRALDNVVAAAERATHLTEQLLTLARLEADVARLDRQPCDLRELLREAAAEAAPEALARGVELEAGEGAPVTVPVDRALLAILLRNLVDNAIRYSGAGRSVRLDAFPATGSAGPALAVTDTGPGLPPAERARVGQRFYRVLGTGEAGSGLGLSIVQRIAALHGGRVELSEGPGGRGLRVAVVLAAA